MYYVLSIIYLGNTKLLLLKDISCCFKVWFICYDFQYSSRSVEKKSQ